MFLFKKFKKIYKEKIKKLKARYDTKLKDERTKFVSILNHDIKTPLLAQIQGLKLVLKDDKQACSEILKEVLNSNCFLYDIIVNAIFLINFENNKPKLKLENVEINNVVDEICESLKEVTKEKQQNIIVKAKKKINLQADKNLVNKLIYNLLRSSLSYGFENSDIEVFLEENKKSISFCAKNKSIYMTKEKLNTLFDDRKNSTDLNQLGMNLNLNVARKLIDAHHWNVVANSSEDNSGVLGFAIKK